jgi:hypothetical protein
VFYSSLSGDDEKGKINAPINTQYSIKAIKALFE